jgi:murein DD-endopeptidase MepM/ murein hydrolase activator NlpD
MSASLLAMAAWAYVAAGLGLLILTGRRRAPSRRYWPLSTYRGVLSGYGAHRTTDAGETRYHAGIDLGALEGDLIIAIDDGEVIGPVSGFALRTVPPLSAVAVRHPDAEYIYAEIDVDVKPGQRVFAGQPIGRVRKNADGNSMLHLEAWRTAPKAFTPWLPGAQPVGLLNVGEIVDKLPKEPKP